MNNRIRIELNSPTSVGGKVFYIHPDGTETDISNAVTAIDLHAKVGQPTTATLHTILIEVEARAELNHLLINEIKPRTEVTNLQSNAREYVERGVGP